MANCYKILKKSSHFLNGDLKDSEKKQFEDHLCECAECVNRLTQTKKLINHLSLLTKVKTSSEFDIVLRSKLRNERNRRTSLMHFPLMGAWGRIPVYATCILLFVASGIFMDRTLMRSTPQSVQLQPLMLQSAAQQTTMTAPAKVKAVKMKNFVMEQYPVATFVDKTDSSTSSIRLPDTQKFVIDSIRDPNVLSNSHSMFRPASAMVRF